MRDITYAVVQMVSEHARKVPIFWGHGTDDPIVRFEYCQRCVSVLLYPVVDFH